MFNTLPGYLAHLIITIPKRDTTHAVAVLFEGGLFVARAVCEGGTMWMPVKAAVSKRLTPVQVQAIYNDGAWDLAELRRVAGRRWPG